MPAPNPTFILTATDRNNTTPTFIGNGSFSVSSSPLGTTPTLSFAAGVFDRATGDVPRIAALPAWNELNVSVGDGWLNDVGPDIGTDSYRQTLDMYDGTLTTSYEWIDPARGSLIEVTTFVSRVDPHLALVHLRLVPRHSGRATVRFPLRDWPPPKRLSLGRLETADPGWTPATMWYPGHLLVTKRDAESVTARTEGGTTRVAVVQSVHETGTLRNLRRGPGEISFDVVAGEPVSLAKLVGVAATQDGSDPLPLARAAVGRAAKLGYDALLAEHADAWHRLWDTDVVVEGDPHLQRVVHAMLFYLLGSIREGSSDSIAPMGLSSAGYYGHIFWDADTWMFPTLALMHPAIAHSIVAFRARTLPAAQRNARLNRYRGAMYPWEADERGDESTPRFARQNARSEIHITGDVAMAQWQYFLASGDTGWLARNGYPVIKETADFWVSRVTYDASADRYDIRDVVSVEEDLIGVDNEAYTNVVARRNLEVAVAASVRLGRAPDPRWAQVSARLAIPYDAVEELHPTYEGAPAETDGSVAPLLAFPLALPMTERAKRNDLAKAVRRLDRKGAGAMMTVTLYALVAAELGDRGLVERLAPRSYEDHLRAPFHMLAETPTSDAVNFVTGGGGFLQQIVFGYTGLRLGEGGLQPVFKPVLPSGIRRIVLRNFSIRGARYDIVVERDTAPRFVAK